MVIVRGLIFKKVAVIGALLVYIYRVYVFLGIVPSKGISKSGMLEYSDFFPWLSWLDTKLDQASASHKAVKLGDGDSQVRPYKVGPVPLIDGAIIPLSRVISYNTSYAISRGYDSTCNWYGATL